MGNTPAKDRQQQICRIYRQQQELIYKQQQQINLLYQFDLDNQELQQQMQIPCINFQTQVPIENQNMQDLNLVNKNLIHTNIKFTKTI